MKKLVQMRLQLRALNSALVDAQRALEILEAAIETEAHTQSRDGNPEPPFEFCEGHHADPFVTDEGCRKHGCDRKRPIGAAGQQGTSAGGTGLQIRQISEEELAQLDPHGFHFGPPSDED